MLLIELNVAGRRFTGKLGVRRPTTRRRNPLSPPPRTDRAA